MDVDVDNLTGDDIAPEGGEFSLIGLGCGLDVDWMWTGLLNRAWLCECPLSLPCAFCPVATPPPYRTPPPYPRLF